MTEKLKPCPFCGGEAAIVTKRAYFSYVYVECIKCDATSAGFDAKDKAIEAWNRRVNEND